MHIGPGTDESIRIAIPNEEFEMLYHSSMCDDSPEPWKEAFVVIMKANSTKLTISRDLIGLLIDQMPDGDLCKVAEAMDKRLARKEVSNEAI